MKRKQMMGDDVLNDDDYLEEKLEMSKGGPVISDDSSDSADSDDDNNVEMFSGEGGKSNKKQKMNEVSEGRITKKKEKFNKLKEKKKEKSKEEEKMQTNFNILNPKELNSFFWTSYISSQGGKLTKLDAKQPLDSAFIQYKPQGKEEITNHELVIKQVMPKYNFELQVVQKKKILGAPVILVISPSGIRCVDIRKSLFALKYPVAGKLFSKHMKVEEQVQMLKSVQCIGVGTPNRLSKLVDIGALNLDYLKLIIIDMSRDNKNSCIFDIPSLRDDLMLFYRLHLSSKVSEGLCKMVLA